METIKVKLGKLKINKDNPRTITKEKMDKLVNSILVFPKMLEIRPIVVDGNMTALGGNQRTEALKNISKMSDDYIQEKLSGISDYHRLTKEEQDALIQFWKDWMKSKEVKVINADNLTDGEKNQFIIKDNNSFGEWDFAELEEKWDTSTLEDWGIDFPKEWYSPEKENKQVKEDEFTEEDAANSETRVKAGDIWKLGEHRLMCGDSTDKKCFDLLMGKCKALISFTSPPYNAGSLSIKGQCGTGKKYDKYDDNKTSDEYFNFIKDNVELLREYSTEVFYNIGLVESNKREIIKLIYYNIDAFKDIIYWEKTSVAPHIQPGVINNLVEFILCFGDGKRKFQSATFSQGTYWNVIKGNSASSTNEYATIHKATFPIYLPENIIKNFSKENDIVLDCFGGTGTTLIACEQLNRKCYMMELSEKYCDIIIQRWEKFTGKEAVKIYG